MSALRALTAAEIAALEAAGVTAEAWPQIAVSDDFTPAQLAQSRLEGRVEIASGACIRRSCVRNYRIGEGALVEGVTALECRHRSRFGNGTAVATLNECGGRTVRIHDRLSAQTAYLAALYRHRPQLVAAIEAMSERYAEAQASELGTVGSGSRIVGARFVREVRIGCGVTIDGASRLENGTVCDGARIGVDVKAHGFICAEQSRVDNGTTLEHVFVGENCILDKGFTASESLFFAHSHCENGEAAAIFAGPYTVSHHKSTLLIAGLFSFFNAGSGSNQSNHLFKSGPVHQAVHLRGGKFASGAYIMAPAVEGPFTMVMGHHKAHHDTTEFPFSYLLEKEGRSCLLPGVNLTSYGTVRDLAKWPERDRRTVGRDVVDFAAENPYLCGLMLRAVDRLHRLEEAHPEAESYLYNRTVIRAAAARRGVGLYNKAVVAALGAMLAAGSDRPAYDGSGDWLDIAGQYITRREVDRIVAAIESGELNDFAAIDNRFRIFHLHYTDYARSWAEQVYAEMLGHAPSAQERADAIAAGESARAAMRRTTDADCAGDCSPEMAVGYGIDSTGEEERMADFRAVRGL